jgi:hypothetical protein
MREYTEPWGSEVGDGWMPVVLDTHAKLKHLDAGYTIDQIKEKFGGLRYYFTPSSDCPEIVGEIMYDVVAIAEVICSRRCELCEQPGELREGGWYKTLCNEHHEEREIAILARRRLADGA